MYLFWWHPFYKYAAFAPVHFILPRAQVPVTGAHDWFAGLEIGAVTARLSLYYPILHSIH